VLKSELPATLLYDCPTARSIAALLLTFSEPAAFRDSSMWRDDVTLRCDDVSATASSQSATTLIVQLPGHDGSAFHFKALNQWLSIDARIRVHALEIVTYTGELTISSWLAAAADEVCSSCFSSDSVVLVAYSNGNELVLPLVEALGECNVAVAALILMDPTFPGPPSEPRPYSRGDAGIAAIATSVMDSVRLEALDFLRVRAALTETFPTYRVFFANGEKLAAIRACCGFKQPFLKRPFVTCSVLQCFTQSQVLRVASQVPASSTARCSCSSAHTATRSLTQIVLEAPGLRAIGSPLCHMRAWCTSRVITRACLTKRRLFSPSFSL
jgi:pimeloyl-ACP methyl ester carboxylesterase